MVSSIVDNCCKIVSNCYYIISSNIDLENVQFEIFNKIVTRICTRDKELLRALNSCETSVPQEVISDAPHVFLLRQVRVPTSPLGPKGQSSLVVMPTAVSSHKNRPRLGDLVSSISVSQNPLSIKKRNKLILLI